ncbi:g2928 [Coccomyxa elongata]
MTLQRAGGSEECSTSGREYLAYFLHRHLDFRLPEIDSLIELAGQGKLTQSRWRQPYGKHFYSPFWYLQLPSDAVAQEVAARSILLKGFLDLWGEGETWEELEASIRAFPEELKQPWLQPHLSMKVIVDGWGRVISLEEQIKCHDRLEFIPFQNPVKLADPDITFRLIIANCYSNHGMPDTVPARMYFGREVGHGNRRVLSTYSLSKRVYLGPTSMDTEIAFIMCNQGKVRKGSFVFDPFAGTGSILVAAAHLGAVTLGADIDIRVLRDGKVDSSGKVADNWANFEDYGLPRPAGLIRADAHRPPFRDDLHEILDAVVCDPPYGVRAGGRKSQSKPDLQVRDRTTHITSTAPYSMGECLRDLLDVSARLLRMGGRLVYFLPAAPEVYREEEIPQHPSLRLVANSEQVLNARYSRRLITMEKVLAYDREGAAAFHAEQGDPRMAIDDIPAIVYEPRQYVNGKLVVSDKPPNRPKYRSKLC